MALCPCALAQVRTRARRSAGVQGRLPQRARARAGAGTLGKSSQPAQPPAATPLCRYSKLSDKELLHRLLQVCQAEGVAHTPDGLEAVVFTADGDMRQALNNVQVRWVGWVGWVGG